MRILVVEDESDVADLIRRALREASWAVDVVGSGAAALEALAVSEYDAAVLDLGLPDIDGLEVCRLWRQRGGRTPILLLTARGALSARVAGLDAGADDYLIKPFAIEELLARIRALIRRPAVALAPVLRLLDLELDPATRTVRRGAEPIVLTSREFALLHYLLRTPRRVVTRAQILEHVWDDNFDPVGNAVDVLLGRVRRKVDRAGSAPLIHTVRGVGYLLSEQGPTDAD
jgi:DNA-binding response OmpR family regulator